MPIQVPKHQLQTQGLVIQSSLNGNPLYKQFHNLFLIGISNPDIVYITITVLIIRILPNKPITMFPTYFVTTKLGNGSTIISQASFYFSYRISYFN